jgi:hypothetical protein
MQGPLDSRYGGVSRIGQDPQIGYGVDSRVQAGQDPQLDYRADSRYGGVSRVGQDPQLGYGAGSRAGGIYSSDYLPTGPYPSVLTRNATGGYGPGSGSALYY